MELMRMSSPKKVSPPKKSNKIVAKSASTGSSAIKAGPGKSKKDNHQASAKASAEKVKTPVRGSSVPAKSSKQAVVAKGSAAKPPAAKPASSKPASSKPAVAKSTAVETASKNDKNNNIKSKAAGGQMPAKGSKAHSSEVVSGKSGSVKAKSVSVKPVAAKASAAKPVQPNSVASAVSKSAQHASAAKSPAMAVAGKTSKSANAAQSVAVPNHNQSEASKNPIVTNKIKATMTVSPAAGEKSTKPAPAKAAAKKTEAVPPKAEPVAVKAAQAKSSEAKTIAAKPAVSAKPASTVKPVAVIAEPKAPAKAEPVAEKVAPAPAKAAAAPVAATPVAAKPAPAPVAVPAPAPVQVNNGVRINAPYRPAVAPAMAKPNVKPGVPHAGFKAGEYIVYPAHGVGQIIAIEEQEVAGFKLELFVIDFVKDKMTLKVPMPKVLAGAIRKLSSPEAVKKSLDTLMGRARVKRTMWSRRAQEYEAKINSGDLVTIAEVVRDLYRSDAQPEQSYSERQLYEAAVDRMGREVAAVQKLTESEALKVIEQHLQRGPKRGAKAEGESAVGEEATIGEAA